MLWSQPIAKQLYRYIQTLHTYRGWFYDQNRTSSPNFEPLKLLVGHVDSMNHLWFIYGSKQAYTILLSNSQFWANQERGPWTKQCPNSDESKFKRLQFYLHISDYLWLSLSLIRLCELQTLIVPWKQNAYKHYVFLFQRSKTTNVLVTSPKYPKAERSIQGTSHVGVRCRTCVESWFPSKLRHMSWWEPRWHTCFLVSHQSHMSYTV